MIVGKALTYVEIDTDYCSLDYGVSPCPAVLGVDSDSKCFNTLNTCPVPLSYINEPVTLRFAIDTDYLPTDIEAIPLIANVSLSPAIVSLGKDLGVRASLTVKFKNPPHSDTGVGFDKYVTERPYDPSKQGSFWGKYRARQPFVRGRPLRLVQGFLGQTLEQMETEHYVIDSFDGPTPNGTYTIVAKDVIKNFDGDRAQAPKLSEGFLSGSLAAGATSASLLPYGIGDLEYPVSGHCAIGGKERCTFDRTGDNLTLVRGLFGTDDQDHDQEDRVQLVLRYEVTDAADIIADLAQNYANVPASYIPIADWRVETSSFLNRVFTADIAEPTSVSKLVSELIEQAALSVWTDVRTPAIRLRVLRQIATDVARFDEDNILEGSLRVREQPKTRKSQIWTYFGKRNPLVGQTDTDNYRSVAVTANLEAETNYGSAAILKIFSRWVAKFGRSIATRANELLLSRFLNPPRRFNFDVSRSAPEAPELGGGYLIADESIQDATGARIDVPIQITRLERKPDLIRIEAEEQLIASIPEEDLSLHTIIIETGTLNFNLRTVHDTLYPAPEDPQGSSPITVRCVVNAGVLIGSSSTSLPAFDTGDWPDGVLLILECRGRVQGKGGDGGDGGDTIESGHDGLDGGPAFYTRHLIEFEISDGELFGGGGGGAGALPNFDFFIELGGGGGGRGHENSKGGDGSVPGSEGDTDSPGSGGSPLGSDLDTGGKGGDAGEDGDDNDNNTAFGGRAGPAIDGSSYVTITKGPGDIRGPEVN